MLGKPCTTIIPVKDEARETLLRSSTFNQCYWLKRATSKPRVRPQKDKCSSRIRMVAEGEVEGEEVDSEVFYTQR